MKSYKQVVERVTYLLDNPTNECELFEGAKNHGGYGYVKNGELTEKGNGKVVRVHCVSLSLKLKRPITSGCEAAHSCRNRNCFNPWHIDEKTSVEHAKDKLRDKTSPRHTGPHRDNKSGYKGVFPRKNRWIAQIQVDGITRYIGCFITKEDAARAYDREAFKAWGNDCYLNFRIEIS